MPTSSRPRRSVAADMRQPVIRRFVFAARVLAYAGGAIGLFGMIVFATPAHAILNLPGMTFPGNSIALIILSLALVASRPFAPSAALVIAAPAAVLLTLVRQIGSMMGWINPPALPGNALMICLLALASALLANRRVVAAQLTSAIAMMPPLVAIIGAAYLLPLKLTFPAFIIYLSGLCVAVAILGLTSHRGPLRHLLAPDPAGRLSRLRILALSVSSILFGYIATVLPIGAVAVPVVVTLMVAVIVVVMSDIAGYLNRRPRRAQASRRISGELEKAIDLALERKEFRLVYQPQVSFSNGAIEGVEVLIRWDHPEMGTISPLDFVPAAEASGQINAIGLWVLERACREAAQWRGTPLEGITLSVNVSPVQLAEADFVDALVAILARTGFPADQLVIELTESALVRRGDPGFEALWELDALGVRISVDDFGTGYSCLAYLRDLPVGFLKIDRSFVRDLPQDEGAAVIARTIVAMGRGLGLLVIAEGVETEPQAEFLKAIDCHKAQGFLYAPPLAAPELARRAQQRRVPVQRPGLSR